MTQKWSKARNSSSKAYKAKLQSPIKLMNRFSSLNSSSDWSNLSSSPNSCTSASNLVRDMNNNEVISENDSTGVSNSPNHSLNNSPKKTNDNEDYIILDEIKDPEPKTTSTPNTKTAMKPPTTNNKKKKSPIVNLSNRTLSEEEKRVLELGLTFCPSTEHYNKERLAEDFYMFIRRLKLAEYFEAKDTTNSQSQITTGDDQCPPKFVQTPSDWYPEEVRNHRSPALVEFIDAVMKDTKRSIDMNATERWNNMNNKTERQ